MASNYDSAKAHEYYLKNRKLKGRHSTKGMSQTQKERWQYAKAQLKDEHKEKSSDITSMSQLQRQALASENKRRREQMTKQANSMISRLRDQLKTMSPAQKRVMREQIGNMISSIRASLSANKSGLTDNAKISRAAITATTKAAREQEAKEYEARKDAAFKKIKGVK